MTIIEKVYANYGCGEVFYSLLSHGANPNVTCQDGEPLFKKVCSNGVEQVEKLFEYGIDFDYLGNDVIFSVFTSLISSNSVDVLKFLIGSKTVKLLTADQVIYFNEFAKMLKNWEISNLILMVDELKLN